MTPDEYYSKTIGGKPVAPMPLPETALFNLEMSLGRFAAMIRDTGITLPWDAYHITIELDDDLFDAIMEAKLAARDKPFIDQGIPPPKRPPIDAPWEDLSCTLKRRLRPREAGSKER